MVRLYVAGTRLLKRNIPSPAVVVLVTAPVAVFVSSTRAPATVALLGSVTVPIRVPVVVWPKMQPHRSVRAHSAHAIRLTAMTGLPPLLGCRLYNGKAAFCNAGRGVVQLHCACVIRYAGSYDQSDAVRFGPWNDGVRRIECLRFHIKFH